MRCPVVVGRDVELAALVGMVSALARGLGSAAFVVGEPGIGKSALSRSLIDAARAQGLVVLAGRSVESQTPVAFGPLAEALLSAMRDADLPVTAELAPFRPALSRLIPQWREPGGLAVEDSPVILGEGRAARRGSQWSPAPRSVPVFPRARRRGRSA
jgi:predicted ATPase